MLRGPTAAVQAFADAVCAQRGVRHGALNLASVQVATTEPVDRHEHRPATRAARRTCT